MKLLPGLGRGGRAGSHALGDRNHLSVWMKTMSLQLVSPARPRAPRCWNHPGQQLAKGGTAAPGSAEANRRQRPGPDAVSPNQFGSSCPVRGLQGVLFSEASFSVPQDRRVAFPLEKRRVSDTGSWRASPRARGVRSRTGRGTRSRAGSLTGPSTAALPWSLAVAPFGFLGETHVAQEGQN